MAISELALVYLAAGLSSRFNGKIKQLVRVGPNEETFIELSIKQALSAPFTKIIFVVGNKTETPFKEVFGNEYRGLPVHYALQSFDKATRDKPFGTVDALLSAHKLLNCPFVVCNGDDLYGEKSFQILANHLKDNHEEATVGYLLKETLPSSGYVNRAVFKLVKDHVKSISPAFSVGREGLDLDIGEKQCCMNIFGLHTSILKLLKSSLDEFKKINPTDRSSELLLHETLSKLLEENKIPMRFYPCSEKWIGLTSPNDEFEVRKFILQETSNHKI